jgi:hypothetical protein
MHRLSGNLKSPRRPANLRLLTNPLSNYKFLMNATHQRRGVVQIGVVIAYETLFECRVYGSLAYYFVKNLISILHRSDEIAYQRSLVHSLGRVSTLRAPAGRSQADTTFGRGRDKLVHIGEGM